MQQCLKFINSQLHIICEEIDLKINNYRYRNYTKEKKSCPTMPFWMTFADTIIRYSRYSLNTLSILADTLDTLSILSRYSPILSILSRYSPILSILSRYSLDTLDTLSILADTLNTLSYILVRFLLFWLKM